MTSQLATDVRAGILGDLYQRNQEVLESKEKQIEFLEKQLSRMTTSGVPFDQLSQEIRVNYTNVNTISFANTLRTNFSVIDTIPVFSVKWNQNLSRAQKNRQQEQLRKWLNLRLELDNVEVREVVN
jgi:hypothetical protein